MRLLRMVTVLEPARRRCHRLSTEPMGWCRSSTAHLLNLSMRSLMQADVSWLQRVSSFTARVVCWALLFLFDEAVCQHARHRDGLAGTGRLLLAGRFDCFRPGIGSPGSLSCSLDLGPLHANYPVEPPA